MATKMIVVSNRLPFVLKRNEKGELTREASTGGLVTAVAPVVVKSGGTWVGWPGIHLSDSDKIPESDPSDKTPGLKSKQVIPVDLDDEEYQLYYNGCCNASFWPLFHSMPDRAIFDQSWWQAYQKVNHKFALRTLTALRKTLKAHPDSVPLIWIHDYHLMMAANSIRQVADEENLSCKIGFFFHIPFPPWDMIKIFPWSDMILQGILGCDLVGFHIQDYCLNFIDCCQRGLGCRVDRQSLLAEHGHRTVRIRPLPIGIPYARFEEMSKSAPKTLDNERIQYILGVDRLDYTKGLVNRILSIEKLLDVHPEYLEKVIFLQIAVPYRTDVKEYQDLKEEMKKSIEMINGRFSTANWSPIRYIYGCISQDELAGFYRDVDVALVTPLRDGMNLVAKEFVACRTAKPGVLILSPFAGAGEMMHEALSVNPYDISNVASVLHRHVIVFFS